MYLLGTDFHTEHYRCFEKYLEEWGMISDLEKLHTLERNKYVNIK